jgi:hypothetical protein
MNSTSLHVLVVDHHSGELSPEVAELLETYLGENAGARAEALRIREALSIAEETVLRHPELGRVMESKVEDVGGRAISKRHIASSWVAKAASVAFLAVLTGGAGFFAGQRMNHSQSLPASAIDDSTLRTPRKESPWARYRIAHERDRSGQHVVRVDAANLDYPSLR